MQFFNCATCSEMITEKHLKAGTAVRVAENIYCFGCITTRVAKVSDSKVLRAMLAGGTERSLLRPVRRVSQRMIAAMPTGKFRRLARRVSERLLGPATGVYRPMTSRAPRRQLPAASCATVAAISRARRDAQHVAIASIACVGIAIVTLMLYIGLSPKNEVSAQTTSAKPALVVAPVAAKAETVPMALPRVLKTPEVRAERPILVSAPVVNAAQPARTVLHGDDKNPPIPPLLMERDTAEPSPRMSSGAHSKPVYSPQPTTFAAWEVENLAKAAMVNAHAEVDGYGCVLETHTPDAEKELRILWKLNVPAEKTIVEFCARADERGEADMVIEIGGHTTSPVRLKGGDWHAFSLDLAAWRGQSVTLVLRHIPVGWGVQKAWWQTPQFFPYRAEDATPLAFNERR
jgi:hypothetical protein